MLERISRAQVDLKKRHTHGLRQGVVCFETLHVTHVYMPDFQGEYEFPIYIIFCGLYRVKSLCKIIICILEYPAIVSNVKKV